MVTLIKYGALSGGEKYNVNVLSIDGLSTDTKPTVTYIEYGSDGREVGRTGIPNGSLYTEIDTGDTYMYDADNTTWHKVSIGGGGGGFTPTDAQLDAMNSGIDSAKVTQIETNKTNILTKANTSDVNTATANLQAQINNIITPVTQDAEVENARIGSDGTSYQTLKARLDAMESSSSGSVKEKYVSTFNTSCLSIHIDKIHYDGTPLAQNHQNYLYLKNTNNVNTFSFSFKGYTSRCGIELANGFKIYIVTLKKSGASDYFGCDIYNGNTSIIRGKTQVNNIPWGTVDTEHLLTIAKNGNYILIYIDGKLLAYITNSVFNQNIHRIGYAFKSGETVTYSDIIYTIWEQYAHVSFDDQISVLRQLTESGTESIYDITEFGILRDAHMQYGCTFTLMLFYEDANGWDLSNVPTTYKDEFIAASDWLKFAYHSHYTTDKAAEDMTAAELVEDMQLMYSAIRNFADENCIDYCPRLGYFSCTKEQAIAISSAGLITGLLTADDVRAVNVGLTTQEKAIMENMDRMSDYDNGILYARSRIRLDSLTTEEVIDTLNSQYNRNNTKAYEIFSHSINQTMVETVADWLSKKNIKYGFAMDNLDF